MSNPIPKVDNEYDHVCISEQISISKIENTSDTVLKLFGIPSTSDLVESEKKVCVLSKIMDQINQNQKIAPAFTPTRQTHKKLLDDKMGRVNATTWYAFYQTPESDKKELNTIENQSKKNQKKLQSKRLFEK